MLPSDERHPSPIGTQWASEAALLRRYLGAAARVMERLEPSERTQWICYLLEMLEPHPMERQERADYDALLPDLAAAISERARWGSW